MESTLKTTSSATGHAETLRHSSMTHPESGGTKHSLDGNSTPPIRIESLRSRSRSGWKYRTVVILDVFAFPFVLFAACFLRAVRRAPTAWLPMCCKAFDLAGIFPIKNHYYEPFISPQLLTEHLKQPRPLPALDWNEQEQLELLQNFKYRDELREMPIDQSGQLEFFYRNGSFGPIDASMLYSMIRHFRPRRIIEIGSGNSTLMAINAVRQNIVDDSVATCVHLCIEPFEMPWLERTVVDVVREKIEDIDLTIFDQLEANDLLFIDSSHIIRPYGDVLTEYLQILPRLKPGVIVHVHDIFSPHNYPDEWLLQRRCQWNEQYLLEAFLSFNKEFRVLCANNYLLSHHPAQILDCCAVLDENALAGSFYFVRS